MLNIPASSRTNQIFPTREEELYQDSEDAFVYGTGFHNVKRSSTDQEEAHLPILRADSSLSYSNDITFSNPSTPPTSRPNTPPIPERRSEGHPLAHRLVRPIWADPTTPYWPDQRSDPTALNPSYITPALNAALDIHFATNPLQSQHMWDDYPEDYLMWLCSPHSTFPPRLRPIMCTLLSFYLLEIVPFRAHRRTLPEEQDQQNWTFQICWFYRTIAGKLTPREKAGLLRDGLVRCVELWIAMGMERLREVMRSGGWDEVFEVHQRLNLQLAGFWGTVRVERVEVLVLRYVHEEGWNEGVVSGVEEAGRRKMERLKRMGGDEEGVGS